MLLIVLLYSHVFEIGACICRHLFVCPASEGATSTAFDDVSASWEFTVSLDFEWLFLSGQKKARWPLVSSFPEPANCDSATDAIAVLDILLFK